MGLEIETWCEPSVKMSHGYRNRQRNCHTTTICRAFCDRRILPAIERADMRGPYAAVERLISLTSISLIGEVEAEHLNSGNVIWAHKIHSMFISVFYSGHLFFVNCPPLVVCNRPVGWVVRACQSNRPVN